MCLCIFNFLSTRWWNRVPVLKTEFHSQTRTQGVAHEGNHSIFFKVASWKAEGWNNTGREGLEEMRSGEKRWNSRTRGAKLHFPGSHGRTRHTPHSCSRAHDPVVHPPPQGAQGGPQSLQWCSSSGSHPPDLLLSHDRSNLRSWRREDASYSPSAPASHVTNLHHVTPEACGCSP